MNFKASSVCWASKKKKKKIKTRQQLDTTMKIWKSQGHLTWEACLDVNALRN